MKGFQLTLFVFFAVLVTGECIPFSIETSNLKCRSAVQLRSIGTTPRSCLLLNIMESHLLNFDFVSTNLYQLEKEVTYYSRH